MALKDTNKKTSEKERLLVKNQGCCNGANDRPDCCGGSPTIRKSTILCDNTWRLIIGAVLFIASGILVALLAVSQFGLSTELLVYTL